MKTIQPTREKILDAAFSLVYVNGYNGTSMDMILKLCAVPKGSLYYHFSSKKDVILTVLKERISPRMNDFYELKQINNEHEIDTIIHSILKVSQKQELVKYGCPLNRLNQEMSPVDEDFEKEINLIYERIKDKIKELLENSNLKNQKECDSLSEFIVGTVWGNLSLSPNQSSKERYLDSIKHLIIYLNSLKK